ncbi:hypothetical protein SAMN05216273_11716 [Chryseobacterium taihuense]|uniref:Uncharacterized protein n=2 Tax=Chryseobacterium taihuense TaxID=1141221 RepID=A0ABY0R034_9FLAO|nr:hypothetical protein SAMN05216273_11716 [Chryseobacterium taihuense]
MRKLFKLVIIMLLLVFICTSQSCAVTSRNNKSADTKLIFSPSLEKIPSKLANAMKKDFDICSYKVLQQIVTSHTKDYHITKEQFKKIYDNFPEKSNILKIHFIQYQKDQNYSKDYPELLPFDKQLYIIYSYNEDSDKYYGIFSLEDAIEIAPKDFVLMKNDYNINIKKEIAKSNCVSEEKQTNYVNIKKDEIKKYLDDIEKFELYSGVKGQIVKFILSTVSNDDTYNGAKIANQGMSGQLTLITDTWAKNTSSSRIAELSDYDLNTLCPSNCDAR